MRKVSFIFVLLMVALAYGEEGVPDSLAQAWKEYTYQSWESSTRFFKEVLEQHADAEWALQAQVGLGMIAQFSGQSPDIDTATNFYFNVIRKAPDSEAAHLARSFLAECLVHEQNHTMAYALWQKVLHNTTNVVLLQDTLIMRTLSQLHPYGSPTNHALVEALQIALKQVPETSDDLTPVLHKLSGDIYFWHNDIEKAIQSYKAYLETGSIDTTGYNSRATVLFKLAQMYEKDKQNPEAAAPYYKQLVQETPNDVRSFFALEKAIASGVISKDEVRDLDLNGVTDSVIETLFKEDNEVFHGGE